MSPAESAVAVKSVPEPQSLRVFVAGKVQQVQRRGGKWYTIVLCPAKDEYSSPTVIEIRADQRIAQVDDFYKGYAWLGGFLGRPFDVTDRDTGEVRKVRSVILTLDAEAA